MQQKQSENTEGSGKSMFSLRVCDRGIPKYLQLCMSTVERRVGHTETNIEFSSLVHSTTNINYCVRGGHKPARCRQTHDDAHNQHQG